MGNSKSSSLESSKLEKSHNIKEEKKRIEK